MDIILFAPSKEDDASWDIKRTAHNVIDITTAVVLSNLDWPVLLPLLSRPAISIVYYIEHDLSALV